MNDYAAHTNGLPKTDFVWMKVMTHDIVSRRFSHLSLRNILNGDGAVVGENVLKACVRLEEIMASMNYNAFGDPEPGTESTRWMEDMVTALSIVYLFRAKLRGLDMQMTNVTLLYPQMETAREDMKALLSSLVDLAESKDREYGASWCKRGGIGAWFTTVRKFDRLITQVRQKGNNIWNVSEPVNSTESLEETIKDGINYLLLILEKRKVISEIERA